MLVREGGPDNYITREQGGTVKLTPFPDWNRQMELINLTHIYEVPITCQALLTAVNKTKPWLSWSSHYRGNIYYGGLSTHPRIRSLQIAKSGLKKIKHSGGLGAPSVWGNWQGTQRWWFWSGGGSTGCQPCVELGPISSQGDSKYKTMRWGHSRERKPVWTTWDRRGRESARHAGLYSHSMVFTA